LGAMSYSLYLIHGRLIPLVAQVLRQVVPSNTLLYDAVLVTATCTICYAFYWVCERPFATTRKKELSGAFEFSRRSSPDQEACQ